jgi:hypothetical protein
MLYGFKNIFSAFLCFLKYSINQIIGMVILNFGLDKKEKLSGV